MNDSPEINKLMDAAADLAGEQNAWAENCPCDCKHCDHLDEKIDAVLSAVSVYFTSIIRESDGADGP